MPPYRPRARSARCRCGPAEDAIRAARRTTSAGTPPPQGRSGRSARRIPARARSACRSSSRKRAAARCPGRRTRVASPAPSRTKAPSGGNRRRPPPRRAASGRADADVRRQMPPAETLRRGGREDWASPRATGRGSRTSAPAKSPPRRTGTRLISTTPRAQPETHRQ